MNILDDIFIFFFSLVTYFVHTDLTQFSQFLSLTIVTQRVKENSAVHSHKSGGDDKHITLPLMTQSLSWPSNSIDKNIK